jgi:hypothetical protein
MKPTIIITQIIMFGAGAFLLGNERATSISDMTIVSWTGFILCIGALSLVFIMSLISKVKKK